MKLTENARIVLEKRYLKKENGKVIETPEDMFKRVAKATANAEKNFNKKIKAKELEEIEQQFYDLMVNCEFLPNSPTLMNAGRDLGQLSACFVLPIEDSMESIFETLKHSALIHKSGGGTGFSFSNLRPKNSKVRTTGGIASGPVSFLKVYNAATEEIKQGGTRRGANMGILRVDHPDIMEFIECKKENKDITNFNISVGITKEFMTALENDDYYELKFNGKIYDTIKASEVFEKIVEHAWKNGEPGIIFLDRLNENNPTPELGQIEATNPCGEQPLLGYEACNLGSINLSCVVDDNKNILWDKLEHIVKWSIRFLDNVVEVNKLPLKKIEEMTKANRKIGLGIMGWADMLMKLEIPYASNKGVELAEKIMNFIQQKAHQTSQELAVVRGSFPNIDLSIYKGTKKRNATCTTIAPTGTISIIAGASSGIEPIFSLSYTKTVLDGTKLTEVNPIFERHIKNNYPPEKAIQILEEVMETGTLANSNLTNSIKEIYKTALEIEPKWHIKMQAAFQKHCDNAVSKTVNFPSHAKREDINEAYLLAYKLGCKGVTVYRTGSREEEVLTTGVKDKSNIKRGKDKVVPRERPARTIGITNQVKTGCGKMYITVNLDQEGLMESFISTGASGGCSAFTEGVGRLVSLALRANVKPETIIDQLTSVSCPNFVRKKAINKDIKGKSCPDIIGKILQAELAHTFIDGSLYKNGEWEVNLLKEPITKTEEIIVDNEWEGEYHIKTTEEDYLNKGICPDCHNKLEFSEGCLKCNCGFSKCG